MSRKQGSVPEETTPVVRNMANSQTRSLGLNYKQCAESYWDLWSSLYLLQMPSWFGWGYTMVRAQLSSFSCTQNGWHFPQPWWLLNYFFNDHFFVIFEYLEYWWKMRQSRLIEQNIYLAYHAKMFWFLEWIICIWSYTWAMEIDLQKISLRVVVELFSLYFVISFL